MIFQKGRVPFRIGQYMPSSTWNVVLSFGSHEIRILNLSGQVLDVEHTDSAEVFISGADLPSGIYILHIQNAQGKQLASRKVVLQK